MKHRGPDFNPRAQFHQGQSSSVCRFAWRWMGERGLRIETGMATLACYQRLLACDTVPFEELMPADGSVLVRLRSGADVGAVLAALDGIGDTAVPAAAEAECWHDIPVHYGGEAGPDLASLAARAGLSAQAYVMQHVAAGYTVAFIGFQPGFPYLTGSPPAFHVPRLDSPRVRVPACSVAVAEHYVGIYPQAGPGGWHIIGHTAAALFDPSRAPPVLLQPGDRVRFVPQ